MRGLKGCKILIVLISDKSLNSPHVKKEVECSFSAEKIIISIRLDDTPLTDEWNYYLSTAHWENVTKKKQSKWIPDIIQNIENKL